MNGVLGSDVDILRYYQAASRKKIQVLAPNINISESSFSVNNKRIVIDFLSGMTDDYFINRYNEISNIKIKR